MSKADDWIEILELKSKYAWYFDTPDFEGLIDLFTEDAYCDFGPYGRWEGKQAIRDGFAAEISAPDNNFPTVHAATNPLIEIDGDEAKGQYYLLDHVLTGEPGVAAERLLGAYIETYRREDGRWRITSSSIRFMWTVDGGRVTGPMTEKLDYHPESNPT